MYAAKITSLGVGDVLLLALLGMAIVFVGLVAIMAIIKIIAPIVDNALLKRKRPEETVAPIAAAAEAGKVPYDGSLGEISLHSVDDKTAALLMAIVAEQLKTPLNELRFISIREVSAT